MKKYVVRITEDAQNDIFDLIDFIADTYKAPRTAEKYLIELYDNIFSLENYAESIQISLKSDILKYGLNARSIVFKNFVIVYTVENDIVYIKAVISGKLVIN